MFVYIGYELSLEVLNAVFFSKLETNLFPSLLMQCTKVFVAILLANFGLLEQFC